VFTTVSKSVEKTGLKVLVHGPPGSGKTRLCATTGDLERTLIISCEAGLLSLADVAPQVAVAEISSLADLGKIYTYLTTQDHDYTWVCLDSVSEIAEVCLADEKKKAKDGRMAYMTMADKMASEFRKFRDLPLNIYFSAKQEPRSADNAWNRPSMPGKALTNDVAFFFDEVFALMVDKNDEGKIVRALLTSCDGSYYAKDRSGKLDLFEPPNLAAIQRKIR